MQITIGLTLLGIGWSASVIAGAAALTASLAPENRPVVQGFSDLAMNLAGALGGLLAGVVVALSGFGTLNAAAAVLTVPVIALVAVGPPGRRPDHLATRKRPPPGAQVHDLENLIATGTPKPYLVKAAAHHPRPGECEFAYNGSSTAPTVTMRHPYWAFTHARAATPGWARRRRSGARRRELDLPVRPAKPRQLRAHAAPRSRGTGGHDLHVRRTEQKGRNQTA